MGGGGQREGEEGCPLAREEGVAACSEVDVRMVGGSMATATLARVGAAGGRGAKGGCGDEHARKEVEEGEVPGRLISGAATIASAVAEMQWSSMAY